MLLGRRRTLTYFRPGHLFAARRQDPTVDPGVLPHKSDHREGVSYIQRGKGGCALFVPAQAGTLKDRANVINVVDLILSLM